MGSGDIVKVLGAAFSQTIRAALGASDGKDWVDRIPYLTPEDRRWIRQMEKVSKDGEPKREASPE